MEVQLEKEDIERVILLICERKCVTILNDNMLIVKNASFFFVTALCATLCFMPSSTLAEI